MKKRMIVDIGMFLCILLTITGQIRNQAIHEWTGILLAVLFVFHQYFNKGWYHSLIRGKYSFHRIVQLLINILLLVAFGGTLVSGICMSQKALPFFKIPDFVRLSRIMHLAFSHWFFVLAAMHFGMHFSMMIKKRIVFLLCILLAIYGGYLLMISPIWSYLLFQVRFAYIDYHISIAMGLFQNFCSFICIAMIVYLFSKIQKSQNS